MKISLAQHRRLLVREYMLQKDGFDKLLNSYAAKLRETGVLYVSQLAGIDITRGNLLLRLSSKKPFPRKNEHLTAFIPQSVYQNPQSWQTATYETIRNAPLRLCELVPVWFQFEDNDRLTIGFRGATPDFMDKLPLNAVIILGPQEPPTEYLRNLIFLVDNATLYPRFEETVLIDIDQNNWHPEPLQNDRETSLLLSAQLAIHRDIQIQGPPGTGKSFLIANLCADFLRQGKRVLVSALTNTALTEVADKEGLTHFVEAGKVYKTSLTTDEIKRFPNLQNGADYNQEPGTLLFTSYYKLSERAKTATGAQFDLVIVEEASQSFLATIGAARHLGELCLIVGDQMQLQPIRLLNDEDLENPHLVKAFTGLATIAESQLIPAQFILENTFRLSPFCTYLTNSFYDDRLRSIQVVSKPLKYPINAEIPFMNKTVHLIKLPMAIGVKSPDMGLNSIVKLTAELHQLNPKASIAVLSFYVITIKDLQRYIYDEVGYSEKVLVETIDRVQGITVDICIFLIPNSGLSFSLNPNRFNVATSRAKHQTILVVPGTLNLNGTDQRVREYFSKLENPDPDIY